MKKITPENRPDAASLEGLFSRLTAAAVVAMKGTSRENHLMEFKSLEREDFTARSDKVNLACTLSAFANAQGGIIIWGVKSSQDTTEANVDQVTSVEGVKNAKLVLSRLVDLTSQACSPFIVGVEHRILKGRTASFVASLIPSSDGGPYMAQLGVGKYYVRSGGSSLPMEHFQVADMFGRRQAPRLSVTMSRHSGLSFFLRVTNEGRGAAHAPFLQVALSTPYSAHLYEVPAWPRHSTFAGMLYASETNVVIHPTMYVDVMKFSCRDQPSSQDVADARLLVVKYKVGALGIAPHVGEIRHDLMG